MRCRPSTVVATLVLACTIAAQDPAPAVAAAWHQFQTASPGPWLVHWHAPTGTPRALFGHGIELDGWRENTLAEARRHAGRALQQHGALLGLGTSEFREITGARMGRTWTFTFAQHFRGLPVIGGRADVRIHMSGKLVHLGSTAWPVPAGFDVAPRIDEATAVGAAWLARGLTPTAVPQPGQGRVVRLVIWGDSDAANVAPFTLAWEVPISAVDAAGQGPIGRAYVDARSGAFLHWTDDKHACGLPGCRDATAPRPTTAAPLPTTCTVMAWTHTGLSPVSAPVNTPLAGVEVLVPGHGIQVTDANGQFTVDLQAPTQITVSLLGEHCNVVNGAQAPGATATLQPGVAATLQLGSAGASEQVLAHTTTYYWTDRVNRWARGILGNSPQLAVADNVTPTVNLASTCNAYYIGNTINFYASGGGCNNTSAASVVAHEWGHGLDDQYSGISQTNGLSEGWGDICSMYLLDDPTIGHDFFVGGGGIRTGTNTRQYPSGSGPHAQGESWMGFAWKFRQNLRQAFGTPTALQVSNDVVLASIAAGANNQAEAVIAAFQADDNDGLLGNGTPHHAQLVAACNAHSLPYPPLQPGHLTHSVLASTLTQGLPRRVELEAVPYSGSFTQVRLHWQGGQQRTMVPTGVANRWQALLPGVMAPQVTQYHFEAQHSGGAVLRLPAVGEYQYTTLAERRLWLEDFETGGVGWTHGATSGSDDWQIGVPVPHPGLPWSDATAAASGTQCAGTDLGAGSDGAYAPASDSWLRSPPIDCTGISSVRLRFKRWVSVAGPTDRIEVRGAGMFTWQSSFMPLIDQGWVVYDTLLPMAANNPAVVIEFRLISAGSVQYGGWNIDDVELYSLAYAVPPPAQLTLLPEQAQQAATMTLQVTTANPTRPFFLVLGDAPGPTSVPGFPTVQTGGNLFTLFGSTDASGAWSTTFAAPPAPPTGVPFWSQVLVLEPNGALVLSNPFLNLFTP